MGHIAAFGLILFCVLPGEEAYKSGKDAEREARYGEAIHAYRACVDSQGPLAPYARIRAAVCLRLGGKLDGAIDELTAVIGDSPEGPWIPLAEHELGQSHYAESNYEVAAVHFERAESTPVKLWWLDDVRWTAAENLLMLPASRPQALTFFRAAAERSPWRQKRSAASSILISFGDPHDVLDGAMGLIRSRALDEVETALKEVKDDALEIDGLEIRWRYAMGRLLMARNDLQENEGAKALEVLTKEFSGEPLARQAVNDLISHNLRREDFAAAEALLARLEEWDPRSSES
ncbi:MAG: tetratricopeptide repeat protein, partial [Candidatus Hydrogenedentes bacterium]|nr:tetratricopeptide repeat protein [Candidatus Hydrogenedentota bacterium]